MAPAGRGLLAWLADYPGRALTCFLALHATVWTVLPALYYPNLPLDLIEALMYGREWQFGYDKLPPLPWWLVEIAYQLVGRDFAYYLLAEIAVVAAFALVYAVARPLVGAVGALISVLIIDGLHYLNFTATKFNHDVIQLPFWALAGFAFHRALRGHRLVDWLLLGLALGLSLWAKYFVVVLATPMALFIIIDRDARKVLFTPGPYIASAFALITAAPHLVWLIKTDFLPLAYADHRAVLPRGWYDHLWHPLQFAFNQLGSMLPSLLIAAALFIPPRKAHEPGAEPQADNFDRRIVGWLVLGPFASVLAMSAVSGRGSVAMWGYPLWLFLGLWLVLKSTPHACRSALGAHRGHLGDRVRLPGRGLLYSFRRSAELRQPLPRGVIPGRPLGREITQRYHTITGKRLSYVVGPMWVGGNVAHYSPNQPRVLVDGEPKRAPWIDLADLKRQGAVVVWWADHHANKLPVEFEAVAGNAIVQAPLTLSYRRGPGSASIGWAIVMPQR